MTERFVNQVAIVTGGSRGIGLASCMAFAQEGAQVVIASIDQNRGHAAKEAIISKGGQALFVQTDVTQYEQVDRLVSTTLEHFGDIDILVNNAGIHDSAPFWEESEGLWGRIFQVNVLVAVDLGSGQPVALGYVNEYNPWAVRRFRSTCECVQLA